VAQPDEAIVGVRAVALNHLDLWVRRGVPGHKFHLPIIPGGEVAGIVEEIREGAGWKRGDEVIVAPGFSCGLCAACLSGKRSAVRELGNLRRESQWWLRRKNRRSDSQSDSQTGVALIRGGGSTSTRHGHCLAHAHRAAQLRDGETVLVQAGGSGVGSAGIQIAKLRHATVYTTVGSAEKAKRAKELGADEAILYRETDFVAAVRALTNKRGVDIVFEHVGGDTFERSLKTLARGGRLVTCGATTGATRPSTSDSFFSSCCRFSVPQWVVSPSSTRS